jgi:predicted dithiol-disulfide oxidoreductase (DUF899 family)
MTHQIVSEDKWISARKQLLLKEKELTRMQDEVNQLRRELPWVRVEKSYVFDTPNGRQSLAQLFDGRSQLVVYHFMFAPGWAAGCVGCSFFADHVDGANIHLAHHDVTFVAISRAPLAEIEAYKKRMGWRFKWVSSHGTDFNGDYHVSFTKDDLAKGPTYYNFEVREPQTEGEAPGISVFFKDQSGTVFHTYSAYARGDERGLGTYMFLDLTPVGRNENGPNYNLTDWVKRHDEYDDGGQIRRPV